MIGLHSFSKLVELRTYGIKLTVCILQNILGRPSVGVDGNLRYEPKALSGGYCHCALVIVDLAGQNAKQCCFAASVVSEYADAFALGNVEAEPVKYIFTQFKGLYKSVDGYVCHYISPKSAYRRLKHGVYNAAGSSESAAAVFDDAGEGIGVLLVV